jgi:hypothetical protein
MQAHAVAAPVRNAGVYHVATATWTSESQNESFSFKTLYDNTAISGSFGSMGVSADLVWTDEGRIPSKSGHPNAYASDYVIRGLQIAYCSSVIGGTQNGGLAFYECYASCTDPRALTAVGGFLFTGPGGLSGTACWLVTFDLTGTSLTWTMRGDCNRTFDGTSALDNFGWTLMLEDQGTSGANGPLLAGDPNNYPEGDGTYYQEPFAPRATGLDTLDQYWLTDGTGTITNGCYWFGGYAGGNPFASIRLELYGEPWCDPGGCTEYCLATENSTGSPADLTWSGSHSSSAGNLTLTSAPVPDQPGIFFHAANETLIPFGNGYLCASGNIQRGSVVFGTANVATYTYDNSDAKHTLAAYAGSDRFFQHWFRDPMGGGAFFNLSDGLYLPIYP